MREIKFRGKTLQGEWVYGYSWGDDGNGNPDIIVNPQGAYKVNPITVSQSTGLKDKNEQEIYGGDIVEAWSQGVNAIGVVQQRIDGLWLIFPAWQSNKFWGLCPDHKGRTTVKIIGNRWDNSDNNLLDKSKTL